MSVSFKKKFALVFACYILISSLHLPLFKAYADSETINYQEIKTVTQLSDEEILKNPNSKSIGLGALATLAPMATPGLIKLLQVFMLSLVTIDSFENGVLGTVGNMLSSLVNSTTNLSSAMTSELKIFLENKMQDIESGTLAFLIAYDNFSTSTGKIVDSVRTKLLKYYQEEFLVSIENTLQKGVNIGTLIYYGVTKFFEKDIFQQMYDNVPSIGSFPSLRMGTYGISNEKYGSSYANRILRFNPNDKYGDSFPYNMSAGYDLDMSFVDKVQITRSNVSQYNYGWDGLHWTQQYYMKTAKDGLQYMIVFAIGKALSSNQKLDYKHDGVSFGLYQVNELGEVVTGNANNVYYRTADDRLNTLVPKTGTNLYVSSTVGVNFGKLRDICVDLWGSDIFPNVPDVWNLGFDATSDTHRLVDYSKNEPGVYSNDWTYQGTPIFPVPGDDTQIKFPTLKPGQGIPGNPAGNTWDSLFPPSTYPDGGTITTPGDWVNNPDIPGVDNPSIPDVENPDIPDVENPDIPDVENPDIPGTDNPDITIPGLDGILDWLNKFWDMLLEFLKKILVPSDTYWIDNFNKIEVGLRDKLPGVEIDRLKDLFNSEKPFEDICINYKGKDVPIVKLSLMNRFISFAQPIIQGFIVIFLLLYNYNQIYFLLRGGSLLGSQNTIDNMEKGKVGGRR